MERVYERVYPAPEDLYMMHLSLKGQQREMYYSLVVAHFDR